MLKDSCYILCFLCRTYCWVICLKMAEIYLIYAVKLIVNGVLHSFRGIKCKISENQVIVRKLAVIAISNETMAEMIDSACFIQLLFLVLLVFPPDNFISHNPICVPLSLLSSLAFPEEDKQAGICQIFSVCTKRKVIQEDTPQHCGGWRSCQSAQLWS